MTVSGRKKLIWRKAAVLGSLWAAFEIVLGTFLHNARVPFKGEFLTAIGVAILVAGHRLWPERGLLWRTGLICAAMRSVAPSAALFGPMTSIAMEGLLAEAGLRLLGGNTAGYLLAGGLAMCWTVTQKLGKLYIIYGADTARVYLRGVEWLQARLEVSAGNAWAPLGLLFAAYFLAGAAAAAAGLKAAGRAPAAGAVPGKEPPPRPAERPAELAHSLPALLLHLAGVAAVLAAGRGFPLPALAAVSLVYGWVCARRYARARALLRHAGVWAGTLLASAAAGLVLGSPEAGLYMAFRAFLLTLAFAAIGAELLHPAIRRALERLGGGVFFETLEYAFASLPAMIAGLPGGREFVRRPLAVLGGAVARAPFLLEAAARPRAFFITGAQGGGKSELVADLARLLRAAGGRPGGICAAGLWENGSRSGFDLVDLARQRRVPLCRRGLAAAVKAGEFGFYPGGLAAGQAALAPEALAGADAIFLDEIGPLELEGGGWAPALDRLLPAARAPLVLVCREHLLERVRARWGLRRAALWRAGETSAAAAFGELRDAG